MSAVDTTTAIQNGWGPQSYRRNISMVVQLSTSRGDGEYGTVDGRWYWWVYKRNRRNMGGSDWDTLAQGYADTASEAMTAADVAAQAIT